MTRQVAAGADRLVVDVDRTRRGAAASPSRRSTGPGRPVRLAALDGSLASDEVAALDVTFRRDGDGWRSTGATLPIAGEWTLTLSAPRPATARLTRVSWPVW